MDTYIHIHIYIYAYIYIYTRIHVYIYTHMYTHICIYIYMYIYIYISMYIHIYVYKDLYTHVCTYIYIYTHHIWASVVFCRGPTIPHAQIGNLPLPAGGFFPSIVTAEPVAQGFERGFESRGFLSTGPKPWGGTKKLVFFPGVPDV